MDCWHRKKKLSDIVSVRVCKIELNYGAPSIFWISFHLFLQRGTVMMRGQLHRTHFMIANFGKKGSTRHLSAYRIVGRDEKIMYSGLSGMIPKETLQNWSPRDSCCRYSQKANWNIGKMMLMLESPELSS